MNQAKQYELDGKTYWVIDDETTYEVFDKDEFDASDICDMCVDGQVKENCPTRDALGLQSNALGLSSNPCEVVVLNDEGYAHYIAKRMTGKWHEE